MKNEYRREMERITPRPEALERLYQMVEGGTEMKPQKKPGRRVAVILVCAALTVTAAAAAPSVRDALRAYLGAFAPYAQTIDGAVCVDQGIEVQVLSAISDDLEARFYLAVRDAEEDRLNECLQLDGSLTAGESKDDGKVLPRSVIGGYSSNYFDLISYDPETRTAIFSTRILYQNTSRPTGDAELSLTGMNTLQGALYEYVSCAAVTGVTLKSLSADETAKVILSPGNVEGTGYTDDVLPDAQVVLAPGQTPMPIEGTEVVRVSSMGFASDGCFHIRLAFAEGMSPWLVESDGHSMFYADLTTEDDGDLKYYVCLERLVEDGVDILFPLVTAEDLEEVQRRQARLYGSYARPGVEIAGDWFTQFQMDYYPSVTLDWTGELAGWQVRQVTVSPLNVAMTCGGSESTGGLNTSLYAVKKDGSTVTAKPGPGRYYNAASVNGEADSWDAYATWRFEEPVEVEDLVSLTLGDAVIPMC